MHRPLGVTVIGCFFLCAGVYLCSVATIMLLAPSIVSTLKALPFVAALKLVSPYATLLVGLIWTLIAWGLFQLRDWARFTATLMLGAGVAWMLPMLLLGRYSGWRMLANLPSIILRIWAVYYLLTPSIIDVFKAKQSEHVSPNALR